MVVFAVTRIKGPSWDPERSRREQRGWTAHAAFMDRLDAVRFLLDKGDDPEKATAPFRGKTSWEEYRQRGWIGTPEQVIERIHALLATGINYVIAYIPRVAYDQTTMRRFSDEIIPRFA